MDFGKLDDLTGVALTLPPDPEQTKRVLQQAKPAAKPDLFIGCAKWGRKEWVGKMYPKGTKDADYLTHYARFFKSIELNATNYNVPPPERIQAWAKMAGDGFTFCPKFPNPIAGGTDFGQSRNLTAGFADALRNFGDTLGPCFFMLPSHFSTDKRKAFLLYLDELKRFPTKIFVEFRHPSWFTGSKEAEEVFDALEDYSIGTVITDTAGRRDVLHQRLSIPYAFIRFVGNREHPTDFQRIDDWAEKTASWFKSGLQSMYFFMHNDEDGEGHSPKLAAYSIKKFNEVCGTDLDEVKFL